MSKKSRGEQAWEEALSESEKMVKGPSELLPDTGGPRILVCDNCYGKRKCPSFHPGSACTIDFAFVFHEGPAFDADLESSLKDLIRVQYSRIKRFIHFEILGYGLPDDHIPDEILVYIRLVERLRKIQGKERAGTKAKQEPVKRQRSPGGALSGFLRDTKKGLSE